MTNKTILAVMATTLALSLAGCAKEEGAMEKMGKSIDEATESAGKSAEEAADKIKDAVDE